MIPKFIPRRLTGLLVILPIMLGGEFQPLAAQDEVSRINVHFPGVTTNSMIFDVASKQGYYREEGIDARLIAARTDIGLLGLLAGNFDFTQIMGATVTAALAGAPLKILMIFDYKSLFWLYSRPEIKRVADLRGKRIAISAFGSGTELALRYVLEKNGLSPKETLLIPMATSLRVQALQSRSVDAAVVSAPSLPPARVLGFNELIFFGDYIETVRGGVATTENYLKRSPDLVRRFIRATLKGLRFYNKDSVVSVKLLSDWLKVEQKVARELYDVEHRSYTESGYRDEAFQREVIRQFSRPQASREEFPASRVFDFRIVRQVATELGGN